METLSLHSENVLNGRNGDDELFTPAKTGLTNQPAESSSTRTLPLGEPNTRAPRDLHSTVARRFMRMLRAHDRARIALLALQSTRPR